MIRRCLFLKHRQREGQASQQFLLRLTQHAGVAVASP